ncbi:MAG TPA: hypothetical protein VK338_00290 [Candidatus Nitrosocosmicus sp.]|nr:hypothetical protein [Candidatus Nitrosocosmicus sp.]
MDTTSPSIAKNKFVIGCVILFILTFLTVFVFIQGQNRKKQAINDIGSNPTAQINTNTSSSRASEQSMDTIKKEDYEKPLVRQLPQVKFNTYNLQTSYPIVSDEVKLYTLKTNFTEDDVQRLARQLGTDTKLTKNSSYVTYIKDSRNKNNIRHLNVNRKTGEFFFYATDGVSIKNGTNDPQQNSIQYLKETGVYDDAMVATNYYRRKSNPGITYVEIHRDWNKLGLPLLSRIGILNQPEQYKLSNLKPGISADFFPNDADIIFSSDNNVGKARPDDFNTILVTTSDKDGRIVSIASNMRVIDKSTNLKKTELKSPQEAFDELKSKGGKFSLTLPAGAGSINPEKLYPENTATSQNADIQDFILSYLEEPLSNIQNTYEPYYIFKGTATLDSGYRTQFVQMVPARINGNKVLGTSTQRLLAQITPQIRVTINPAQPGTSLQYATVEGITGVPVSLLVTGHPNIPKGTNSCPASFTYQYKIDGGYLAATHEYVDPKGNVIRNWYYLPDNENENINILDFDCKIEGRSNPCRMMIGNQMISDVCPRYTTTCPVRKEAKDAKKCIYVDSMSPSIYIYSHIMNLPVKVQVKPYSKVTYTDPIFNSQSSWSGRAHTNGQIELDNSISTHRLYYEYEKTQFMKEVKNKIDTTKGFSVKRSDLLSFISNKLGPQIGLNNKEKEDLVAEVKRETALIHSEYVSISFVDKNILDTYLPISISPKPEKIQRIHLYISPTSSKVNLSKPTLQKIERTGYTVVETGVIVNY